MPAERNAFKLGLTMILFITLFVAILVFFAPRGGGDVTFQVRFPHNRLTTVLKPGNLVRCGGDTVGSVSSLELQEMKAPGSDIPTLFSVVTIKIGSRVGLRRDCKITPVPPLLGEGGQLVIQDRGDDVKLADGAMVEGSAGADLSNVMQIIADQLNANDPSSLLAMIRSQFNGGDPKSMVAKVLRSLDDLNAITASLNREFDPREKAAMMAQFHSIMDNVNQMTGMVRDQMDQTKDAAMMAKMNRAFDTLQAGLQTLVAMLSENREPLKQTMTSIRNTSQILETQIATRIARQLDTSDAASLMAKTHVSIDRLGKSLADMNAITGAAKEVMVLNKEQINGTITNFKETSDHLKGAALEIRRSPWRLLYQPTLDEVAEANVFDAARAFSEAATRLDDAAARLQSVQAASGPQAPVRDAEMVKIREQLQQTFTNFSKAEAALWQQLKIK